MKVYMGLSCKMGAYSKILMELLDLKIPKGDIFLLFGPVDIMIQFTELKSLDEFKEKWFNRIRLIGAEEVLITRTLTFIVISEGPFYAEEPYAFIFLNTIPSKLEDVHRALLKIPGVISADSVFGPYDVICPIRAKDKADVERVISNIQSKIHGLVGTMTAILASMRI